MHTFYMQNVQEICKNMQKYALGNMRKHANICKIEICKCMKIYAEICK